MVTSQLVTNRLTNRFTFVNATDPSSQNKLTVAAAGILGTSGLSFYKTSLQCNKLKLNIQFI